MLDCDVVPPLGQILLPHWFNPDGAVLELAGTALERYPGWRDRLVAGSDSNADSEARHLSR